MGATQSKEHKEGIKKQFIIEIFAKLFDSLSWEKRVLPHQSMFSMIFNMQNFDDILFFYVYGQLD